MRALEVMLAFVLASFAIFFLHDFIVVDACLDAGGAFDQVKELCTGPDSLPQDGIRFSWALAALYFAAGSLAFQVSLLALRRVMRRKRR